MTQICAWCKKEIRDLGGEEGISDGLCLDCRKKHFPETLRSVREQAEALVAKDAPQRNLARG
jgi:hypothetical protein